MGYNRVVLLLNDFQSEVDKNPTKWWGRCKMAFYRLNTDGCGNFSSGQAVCEHHADDVSVILAGGNYATVVGTIRNGSQGHHAEEDQVRILKEVLDRMGYTIRKKSGRKTTK